MQSFRTKLALATALSLVAVALPVDAGVSPVFASPDAGDCALESGNWVCNASGTALDFSSGTDPDGAFDQDDGSGGDSGDNVNLQSGEEAVYTNVFPSYVPPPGGGTISARVTASNVSGVTDPIVDGGGFGLGSLDVSVNNSEVKLTIEFFNSGDGSSVTFENLEVMVEDLDGGTQDEFAAFSGIKSYTVLGSGSEDTTNDPDNSASILRVDFDGSARDLDDDTSDFGFAIGEENPTSAQEQEVRLFYGSGDQTQGSRIYEKKSFVSVAFHSTSRIALTAGSSDGSGIIGFAFGGSLARWNADNSALDTSDDATAGAAPSVARFDVGNGSFVVTFDRNSGQYSDTVAVPDVDPDTAGVQTQKTFTGDPDERLPLGAGMSATVSGATVPISSWNTESDGTGTSFPVGGTFRTFEDITLYAHYASFTTTLKAGGSGEADVTQTGAGPTSLQSNPFTRSGYRFTGWESAEGDTYSDGATLNFNRTWELTAQWAEEFDVTFDANGGSGTMAAQTEIAAASIRTNSFTRSGYTFSGWNTAPDGTGTSYAAGASFPFTADDILYAQWTLAPSNNSGGSSSGSSSSSATTDPITPPATLRPNRVAPVTINTDPISRPFERLGLVFDPDAPSRATVGGRPANLVQIPDGRGRLTLNTGSFLLGVKVDEERGAEVQDETPSRSPELFVPRGESAVVSGGGSYPGSFVQLFLPGDGQNARELARVPVQTDGSFSSDLSFATGPMEMPVPIGRQVLQAVGYDEQGNQTVIDMTINIGQGVPTPEPNRQVGALPDLNAGESLATSGGLPETVSITGVPETGNVVVEGSGWVISVNADRDNGVVENADGNVLVRLKPSSVGTAFGNGFLPGTLATLWLFSEPTLMTTVTIDENGEFSSEFLVDARLIAPGEHTLQVQGVGADGYIKAANLGVLVEQPVELTTESTSGLLWWVAGGFLLLLLVVLFVIVARRRRA